MPGYKNQFIISLQIPSELEDQSDNPQSFPRRGGTAYMLTKKAAEIRRETETLYLDKCPAVPKRKNFQDDASYYEAVNKYKAEYEKFKNSQEYRNYLKKLKSKITSESILYIVGHGSKTDPTYVKGTNADEDDFRWTVEQLGDLIYHACKDQLLSPYLMPNAPELKLTISFVACYSGKGLENSLAANLSDYLWDTYELKTDIYGRVGSVSRYNGKEPVKRVSGKHHEDESKILVTRGKNDEKIVLPIFYSMSPALRFISDITNSRPNDWHYRKATGNLVSDLNMDFETLQEECNFLNSKYSELKLRIVKSKTGHYRLVVKGDDVLKYLKNNGLSQKYTKRTAPDDIQETNESLIAFLTESTSSQLKIKWIVRESQVVTDITKLNNKNELDALSTELNKKFPLLNSTVAGTRDQSQGENYRLIININNLTQVMREFKKVENKKNNSDDLKKQSQHETKNNLIVAILKSENEDQNHISKSEAPENGVVSHPLSKVQMQTESKKEVSNHSDNKKVETLSRKSQLFQQGLLVIEAKKIAESKRELKKLCENHTNNIPEKLRFFAHKQLQHTGSAGFKNYNCFEMLLRFIEEEKKYVTHKEFLKTIVNVYSMMNNDEKALIGFRLELKEFLEYKGCKFLEDEDHNLKVTFC